MASLKLLRMRQTIPTTIHLYTPVQPASWLKNEMALKLARLASGNHYFISTVNGFHGKSLGAVSKGLFKRGVMTGGTLNNAKVNRIGPPGGIS